MTEEVSKTDLIWNRLTELEQHRAATTSDIRGIYAGLDEIRDVLVRLQENNKPNVGGMFLALLATCTFIVTIGGLSLAPIYRDLSRMNDRIQEVTNNQNTILSTRFTEADGQRLSSNLHANMDQIHAAVDKRLLRNEDILVDLIRETGISEGYRQGYMANIMENSK